METLERIALAIEYLGTDFSGSQRQAHSRTVQQELEEALSRIADHSVKVTLAGRTDSGVHATQQVANFSTHAVRPLDAWVRGVNTYLSSDLAVRSACVVDEKFNARFSARWRRYMYVFGEAAPEPAIGRDLVHWIARRLDHEGMHEASQTLLGEHDFTSFRAAGCQSSTPMRCIHKIDVIRLDNLVVLDVIANAFLLRMVRNIAGALLDMSNRNLSIEFIAELLAARDRNLAPPTAPARGLYLVQVWYEGWPSLSKSHLPLVLGKSTCFSKQPDVVCSVSASAPSIR